MTILMQIEELSVPVDSAFPERYALKPQTEKPVDQELANLEDDADKSRLYAVHVCVACGHETLRSEMDAQALISGVVVCPACGDSGPLNVVIRSSEDKKPPKGSTG